MWKNKRTGRSLHQELKVATRKMKKLLHRDLPAEAETKLGEMWSESFRQEKYTGKKPNKWKHRKGEKGVRQSERRNILVKDGDLSGSASTFSNSKQAGIETNIPYAQVHNEGLKAGRGKGFKMDQRQFMPIPGQQEPRVTKHLYKYLDKQSDKILK